MSEQDASDADSGATGDGERSDGAEEDVSGETETTGPDTAGNGPRSDDASTKSGAGETASADGFPFDDVEAELDDVREELDDVRAGLSTDDGRVDADSEADVVEGGQQTLLERVEEADPETIARELATLQTRVGKLEEELRAREGELEDVTSKLKRKQADFQNYKKRMKKRREEERERATEDLVSRLLEVRDNLARALEQDDPAVEDLRSGVESTLKGFDRVLDEENVDIVEPEPGEKVDPQRHEVLMRVESDQPADTIADVHRPGYVMAEKVIRPAQVTVSETATDESTTGQDDS